MRNKSLLVAVTGINWLLVFACAYVLLTSPYLASTFVPSEVVLEPIFTSDREVGRSLIGLTAVALITAVFNSVVLFSNRRSAQVAEKAKRTLQNPLAESYVIVDDEDDLQEAAQLKQKRRNFR